MESRQTRYREMRNTDMTYEKLTNDLLKPRDDILKNPR